jgi:hypothetical protein
MPEMPEIAREVLRFIDSYETNCDRYPTWEHVLLLCGSDFKAGLDYLLAHNPKLINSHDNVTYFATLAGLSALKGLAA